MNASKVLLAALLSFVVASCVTVRSEMLTDLVFAPYPDEHPIPHFAQGAQLERPSKAIAIVYGGGPPGAAWSWDAILESMKDEARRIGADALVLIESHTKAEGTSTYVSSRSDYSASGTGNYWERDWGSYQSGATAVDLSGRSTGSMTSYTEVNESKHISAYAIRWLPAPSESPDEGQRAPSPSAPDSGEREPQGR